MTDKIIDISQARVAKEFGGLENMGKVYYPQGGTYKAIPSFVAYNAPVTEAELSECFAYEKPRIVMQNMYFDHKGILKAGKPPLWLKIWRTIRKYK